MLALIHRDGLPLVALLLFAGELGLPTGIPIEIAVLLVGSYDVQSPLGILGSLALLVVADLLGSSLLYLAMRTSGRRVLLRLLRGQAAAARGTLTDWRRRLGGHDVAAVAVGRVIPLVRMYVSIGAGLLDLPLGTFLLGALPAAIVWAGIPLTLGYLLRADVQRVIRAYTLISHAVLVALPVVIIIVLLAWWVRAGESARVRLRRGRAVLGLLVAVALATFVVRSALRAAYLSNQGDASFPLPFLVFWLFVLAIAVVALVGVAVVDLRSAHRAKPECEVSPRRADADLAGTLIWVAALAAVGVIVIGLELHYPAL